MKAGRIPDYLDRMLEAASLACSYIQDMDVNAFTQDKKTQQAVILNLILIGEEAARILRDHEEFAIGHAHLPWRAMKGMRNRIAHGYFEVNLQMVWDTTQTALPMLIQQLCALRSAD